MDYYKVNKNLVFVVSYFVYFEIKCIVPQLDPVPIRKWKFHLIIRTVYTLMTSCEIENLMTKKFNLKWWCADVVGKEKIKLGLRGQFEPCGLYKEIMGSGRQWIRSLHITNLNINTNVKFLYKISTVWLVFNSNFKIVYLFHFFL